MKLAHQKSRPIKIPTRNIAGVSATVFPSAFRNQNRRLVKVLEANHLKFAVH